VTSSSEILESDFLKKPLQVAVIGLGKMGLLHSCILNIIPNVEVVGLCEKNNLTRRVMKKLFRHIEIVDDVEKLDKFILDAVFITTPITSHYPIAETVLSKKIAPNLFVEKTLANNYSEAEKLRKLVHDSNGVNMVGYLRRFYVTFQKAKELLSQDAIGDVLSFKTHAYSADFCDVASSEVSCSRGGVLRDLGSHAIDMALWLLGDFTVYSGERIYQPNSSVDSLHFKVENGSKLEGEFNISWSMSNYRMPDVGVTIKGTKGSITANDDKVTLQLDKGETRTWHRHNLDDNVPFWLGLPEYYREDLYFVESLANHTVAEPDFHSAAKVDKIINQVEQKANEE
jgi:predicted dehydrogenase